MPPTPKSPSSLLRSLGADEAMLDTKLRSAAKEAEQRWPLFRALAPTKAEATPALSAQEKQAWEQSPVANTMPRKPLLSRPGLSNKLATGLEKLVPGKATPAQRARPTAAPPAVAAVDSEAARQAKKRSSTPTAEAPTATLAAAASAAQATAAREPRPSAPTASSPKRSGLFGAKTSTNTVTQGAQLEQPSGTTGTSSILFTNIAQSAPDDSLQALFARVEGQDAAPETARKGRSTNPLMRRIGKR